MGGTTECRRATSAGSRYAILSDEGTDSTSPGASETLIQDDDRLVTLPSGSEQTGRRFVRCANTADLCAFRLFSPADHMGDHGAMERFIPGFRRQL